MTERTPMKRAAAWLIIVGASLAADAILYWLLGLWAERPLLWMLAGNLATLLVMALFLHAGNRVREQQADHSEAALRLRLLALRRTKYPDVPDNLLLASEETLQRLQRDINIDKLANDNKPCPGCNGTKTYRSGMLRTTCTVCDGSGRALA